MSSELVFRGRRSQRGYGLGGFFAKLLRNAIPVFKKSGKYLIKKSAKVGVNTLRDIASGDEPKYALKRRVADISDELIDDLKLKIRKKMTGGGDVYKKAKRKKTKANKKKNKKKKINIKKRKKENDLF